MITRIEIDGFKSFRHFHLDLEPFQVIVGLNAAGKSNLLDAFRFLAKIVTSDLKTAYQAMWETTGELFTLLPDGTTTDRMIFAIDFLVEASYVEIIGEDEYQEEKSEFARLRWELGLERQGGASGTDLVVASEKLIGIAIDQDCWVTDRSRTDWEEFLQAVSRPSDYRPLRVEVSKNSKRIKLIELRAPKDDTTLGKYHIFSHFAEAVFQALSQTAFLDIVPDAVRAPVSSRGPDRLKENGTYLANVLARMKREDDFLLMDVGTDLSNLVSGLIRVEVEEDEALGHQLVWVHTAEGKRLSLRELSDGTLRLLTLAALRNDPAANGTLLLEEPENGVHPARVKLLAKLLREMASDFSLPPKQGEPLRQVIATSHSPMLVSQLEDHEIVFAHTAEVTIDGQTKPLRITRMSSLQTADSAAQKAFTRRELLRYLDEKDLESRSKRLRGAQP